MVRLILEYPPTFPGITGVHYLISRGMFEIILILCNQNYFSEKCSPCFSEETNSRNYK